MSSTTPNLGLTKTTAAETIGQNWAASNDSGGNFDIIDTKMGAVGSQSVQAQLDALNSNMATKANIQKGNLAGGASETLAISRPAFVSVGRASNTGTSTTAFIDGWGITYLSNNTGAFTLSMTDNNLTITNLTSGYCSFMVVY